VKLGNECVRDGIGIGGRGRRAGSARRYAAVTRWTVEDSRETVHKGHYCKNLTSACTVMVFLTNGNDAVVYTGVKNELMV
jgi:hypothetical protein